MTAVAAADVGMGTVIRAIHRGLSEARAYPRAVVTATAAAGSSRLSDGSNLSNGFFGCSYTKPRETKLWPDACRILQETAAW